MLVGLHVEDGDQPRNLHQVMNSLGEVDQFQITLRAANRCVGAHHFADAGTVDIVHIREVEKNFQVAAGDQIPNRFAESRAALAKRNLAAEIYHGDVANFPASSLQAQEVLSVILLRLADSAAGISVGKLFHQHELGSAARRMVHSDFVHEGTHQEDTPTGCA